MRLDGDQVTGMGVIPDVTISSLVLPTFSEFN
jgi:hypothetical protein